MSQTLSQHTLSVLAAVTYVRFILLSHLSILTRHPAIQTHLSFYGCFFLPSYIFSPHLNFIQHSTFSTHLSVLIFTHTVWVLRVSPHLSYSPSPSRPCFYLPRPLQPPTHTPTPFIRLDNSRLLDSLPTKSRFLAHLAKWPCGLMSS